MFGSESGVVEHSIIHAKSPIMCLPLHPAILGNMFKNRGRESLLASHLKDKPVLCISAAGRSSGPEPFSWGGGPLNSVHSGREMFALCQTFERAENCLNVVFILRIHTYKFYRYRGAEVNKSLYHVVTSLSDEMGCSCLIYLHSWNRLANQIVKHYKPSEKYHHTPV